MYVEIEVIINGSFGLREHCISYTNFIYISFDINRDEFESGFSLKVPSDLDRL